MKYIVYTKKDCKCTTQGYFPPATPEKEFRNCIYCRGAKYTLVEVDLKDAIIDLLGKNNLASAIMKSMEL